MQTCKALRNFMRAVIVTSKWSMHRGGRELGVAGFSGSQKSSRASCSQGLDLGQRYCLSA